MGVMADVAADTAELMEVRVETDSAEYPKLDADPVGYPDSVADPEMLDPNDCLSGSKCSEHFSRISRVAVQQLV